MYQYCCVHCQQLMYCVTLTYSQMLKFMVQTSKLYAWLICNFNCESTHQILHNLTLMIYNFSKHSLLCQAEKLLTRHVYSKRVNATCDQKNTIMCYLFLQSMIAMTCSSIHVHGLNIKYIFWYKTREISTKFSINISTLLHWMINDR